MTLFKSSMALVPPPENLTVPQFMLDGVDRHPSRPERSHNVPCLIDEESGRPLYLPELRSRVDALARVMKTDWGIGENDIVSVFIPNHIDYLTIVWAIHRVGAISADLSPILTRDELIYHLQLARPSLIISHNDNMGIALEGAKAINLASDRVVVVDEKQPPRPCKTLDELIQRGRSLPAIQYFTFTKIGDSRKKIAFLCFSSGTTGKPKAVAMSHYNVICNVIQSATHQRVNDAYTSWEERRFRPGDVCTGVLPFYHIYGIVTNLHWMVYSAMTVVVTRKFKFETMLQSIQQHRITHLMIVPPQAVLICKHPASKNYNLSSVRYCMVAAAPMTAELTAQLLEALPGIHLGQGYGSTEACAAVTMFPTTTKVGKLGSAGQLVPGTTAKVVKTDGTLAGVGERGELAFSGGNVTLGYYANEKATAESYKDGWYFSGDEVYFDKDGEMFVTDRIKELIKVKGFQVAPAELEGHLLDHPQVADACVVGVPDDYAGEAPLAFVVLLPEAAAAVQRDQRHAEELKKSIFQHVASAKSSYKWLTGGIVFLDAIPKSPSGKILRRGLRERAKQFKAQAPPRARL